MKIHYRHIVNNIKDNPDINDLSEKLFQLGHEHEIQGEIINLELTPNRGDCLSIRGLLRDLNLFYDTDIDKDLYDKDINHFDFKFTNNSVEACPKISFLKIEIESAPDTYCDYLENYFIDLEINKNNFFTDVSNYLSYETGQPTHCYKASEIESGINLNFNSKKQIFETLLEKKIEVDSHELIFTDIKDKIINLAGVMGGLSSSCDKDTKSVIIECAYFNPEAIMGMAVKHAINSEAAHKFERNVDPSCHDYILKRLIKIIEDHSKILNVEFCSMEYGQINKKEINFDTYKIDSILGIKFNEKAYKNYLQRLGFKIDKKSIEVPPHRHDINNINDISEEIARAIGYDNIQPKKFIINSRDNEKIINKNEFKIKNLLINNGFCEVINDPFTFECNKASIEIDNPLDANRRYLRTSLKQSLLENLIYNEKRQQDSIKLFEIADIYSNESNSSKRFAGIIMSGRVDKNYLDFNKKLDKKYLLNIFQNHIDDKTCLNFEDISRVDLKLKSKNTITYLEIELNKLFKIDYSTEVIINNDSQIKYTPISEYPSSTRDLSFSITDFSKSEVLQEYLLNFKDSILKDVFIFDYFVNEKSLEIKIGFRFIFQSNQSTITEQDVNEIMDIIISYTQSIEGINIPGI